MVGTKTRTPSKKAFKVAMNRQSKKGLPGYECERQIAILEDAREELAIQYGLSCQTHGKNNSTYLLDKIYLINHNIFCLEQKKRENRIPEDEGYDEMDDKADEENDMSHLNNVSCNLFDFYTPPSSPSSKENPYENCYAPVRERNVGSHLHNGVNPPSIPFPDLNNL